MSNHRTAVSVAETYFHVAMCGGEHVPSLGMAMIACACDALVVHDPSTFKTMSVVACPEEEEVVKVSLLACVHMEERCVYLRTCAPGVARS